MNRKQKRQSLFTKALLAALALAFLVAPALAESPCEQAAKWVEANRDALPQTLEDFAEVPEAYRSAAFMALPAEERNELWTAHLESFLAERPELSAEERARIESLGDLFERPEAVQELKDVEELRDVLAEFGPEVDNLRLNVLPAQLPTCNCNCNQDSNCEPIWCLPTQSGCGPDGSYPCNCLFQW